MCLSWDAITMFPFRRRIVTYFLLGLTMLYTVGGLPELIRIGGLFGDGEDKNIEAAFRYAINRINQDRTILKKTKLLYDIQHLPPYDSFHSLKKACNQAGLGIAAVFGPQSHSLAAHVNSMCNALEIPHLESRLENAFDHTQLFSINLYPQTTQLSKAYIELLQYFSWKDILVIYGDQTGLLQLQEVIKAPYSKEVQVTVRQANATNMKSILKEANKKHLYHIIADLDTDLTFLLLKTALQLGMIDSSHHYVLTNLDVETIDMEDYRHNFVNLTAFRLVERDEPRVQRVLEDMSLWEKGIDGRIWEGGYRILNKSGLIETEAALVFDSVYALAHGLQQLDKSSRLRLVNLSCDIDQAWAFGSSLYNYLNLVEIQGLTGKISFEQGRRMDFKLDILHLKSTGLIKVGYWTPLNGINFTLPYELESDEGLFSNKTLSVTTIMESPYVMPKKSEEELQGNDRYEGFCLDLLEEIAQIVGFRYKVELVSDGKYGASDENGEWNGMVKELITKRADLAVASLTISYVREQVIDFTKPFMNLGISILFKVPKRESPGLFSFLNPLAIEIWLYVIAAYLAVSFLMYILARFSPYEWHNPHPCNPDTDLVENAFTLSNSFWFAVGTLMQQGSDIDPRAVSTRIVGGVWWFFTLIIISSYTANLAAFLTVERMVSPIESAEDLSKQTKISYGTISGGSTMTFFKDSKIETYQRMWSFMESKEPSVFVSTSDVGIQRVLAGNYAYLMESTMIEFQVQRNCELMQVGGLLDSKGYGIGTPIGSIYRDRISMAILELQENGKIQMLFNKWWKNQGTCNRDDKKQDSKANALGVENVGGIFVVLIAGLGLAIIVSVLEFVWNSRKNAAVDKAHQHGQWQQRQSLCSEMAEELRFAMRCHGSTKKPALRRQCSKCAPPSNSDPAVDSPNGIIQLMDIKKSPMPHSHNSHHGHRDYHPVHTGDFQMEYRDTQT